VATVSVYAKSSDSGLIASHALSVLSQDEKCAWIVDSGTTCHMRHDENRFTALYQIKEPIDMVLGDGHSLTATGRGKVVFRNGITKWWVKSLVVT